MVSKSLEKFNECIGYEKFLLEESLNVMSVNTGKEFRFSIIFLNHEYNTHNLELHDSLSRSYIPDFIKQHLLPLIFISSYKIIDMFVEFILQYNNYQVPWRFAEKIKIVQSLINNLKFPRTVEGKEFGAIFELYKSLVDSRNSLVHGSWGEINDGNLVFNNGTNISTEKVIAFANVSYLITKIINMKEDDQFYNSVKYTLHKNLNIVSDLSKNKFVNFPENIVLYYEIKYKIEDDDKNINMIEIRKHINNDLEFWKRNDKAHNFEGIYDLLIISEKSKWRIPSSAINEDVESINLSDYMNYICK